ncbi:hypothetical protein RFI_37557 [Reticulomyxa filosa]|uniref:RGS domain-containing protein n=1 Tax=Reticulomyxa filosa TaxID=46433 RepID=X6LD56_RETFI|nr:hypothetical protein RFI_37557 [Reticulomyxa filosa]|eukprot:ETN99907.1 hypothetical protein RFI_37557 [Reticulomyxa filosa]
MKKKKKRMAKVSDPEKNQKPTLRTCMEKRESFNLFVTHLQREFSLENLVASIELYQFAQLLLPLVPLERQKQFQYYNQLGHHKFAPISYIVAQDFTVELKILLFYQKYVSARAHFEVNVPSLIKDEWKSFCETIKSDYDARNLDEIIQSLYVAPDGGDGRSPGQTASDGGIWLMSIFLLLLLLFFYNKSTLAMEHWLNNNTQTTILKKVMMNQTN